MSNRRVRVAIDLLEDLPINVDALSDEELQAMAREARLCERYIKTLVKCLRSTVSARALRRHGMIQQALMNEQTADRHYKELPTDWRW